MSTQREPRNERLQGIGSFSAGKRDWIVAKLPPPSHQSETRPSYYLIQQRWWKKGACYYEVKASMIKGWSSRYEGGSMTEDATLEKKDRIKPDVMDAFDRVVVVDEVMNA